MEKEFNLSDKIIIDRRLKDDEMYMQVKDVKKFIKKLKEESSNFQCSGEYCNAHCNAIDTINELVGEKLI